MTEPAAGGCCPLCGGGLRSSAVRPVEFAGRRFQYLRCGRCRSLVCDPMPDEEVLGLMYGSEAAAPEAAGYEVTSPRDTEAVVGFLNGLDAGRIVDFGCGDGEFLAAVGERTGWEAVGVEWHESRAARARQRSGAEVRTYEEVVAGRLAGFDAVHLGDVLEHLTDLDRQLPLVAGLVRPGGYVLAEGPLQAGPALFELAVQAAQAARRRSPVAAAPYHVIQATAGGQRTLFRRHGLVEQSYVVYEVEWPAPSRIRGRDLGHPRSVALWGLRRVSMRLSPMLHWGNRYRYVGTLGASMAATRL